MGCGSSSSANSNKRLESPFHMQEFSSDHFSHPQFDSTPHPQFESKSHPQPGPTSQPQFAPNSYPQPGLESHPQTGPILHPQFAPNYYQQPRPEFHPQSGPAPQPQFVPKYYQQPGPGLYPQSEPAPQPQFAPNYYQQPGAELYPQSGPVLHPQLGLESQPQSERESNPQFESESHPESEPKSDPWRLTRLSIPKYISHLKSGNTLSTNDNILILQDGSSTIEVRTPPDFKPKKIPWRNGMLRDIVWSTGLNAFILLAKNTVFTLNPSISGAPQSPTTNSVSNFTIHAYSQIKPYDERYSFWRCACIHQTLYITYTGFGTVIDEYTLTKSSCKLINRWTSPTTCAAHEGIWCIRYHPEADQFGFSIVDATNNQWRLELRTRENFAFLWKINLPFASGDCEICPFPNSEWLATNSFNVRLIQIGKEQLQAAVEYERELKNAIVIANLYLVVRTKDTIEIHRLDSTK